MPSHSVLSSSETPRIVCQAPLFMEFSLQEYWSGLMSPPPGDLPNSGIKPVSRVSCIAGRFLTAEPNRKPDDTYGLA